MQYVLYLYSNLWIVFVCMQLNAVFSTHNRVQLYTIGGERTAVSLIFFLDWLFWLRQGFTLNT